MTDLKIFFFFSLILLFPILSFGQSAEHRNSVHTNYEYVFVEDRSDWNLASIGYEHKFNNLTSILSLRYADRFNRSAYLMEVDLYPVFSKKIYGRINVGTALSREELFPKLKASGTLFFNLKPSLVAGLGLDYRSFEADDVIIYHSHLNWYFKEYLFLGEALLQVRSNTPLGTGIFTVRRYFSNDEYLFLKVAYGQSPQALRFEQDLFQSFRSYFLAVGAEAKISNKLILRPELNFRESIFSSATKRARTGVSVGLEYQF